MEFYKTADAEDFIEVKPKNSAIIGVSDYTISNNINADLDLLANTIGMLTPRSDNFRASNIAFYNFPPTSTIFTVCAKCNDARLFVSASLEQFFSGISYTNVQGNYLRYLGQKKDILYKGYFPKFGIAHFDNRCECKQR